MNLQLLEPLLQSPELPQLIEELKKRWEDEQKHRHAFWENIADDIKAEFIQGEIVYHSPVKRKHARTARALLQKLLNYNEEKKLGEIGYEKMMIRLTRNDYEPDICFWLAEKSDNFDDEQSIFPAPDFIVEVISKSTEKIDRGIKFQDYETHQVSEYWLIDPGTKTLEQYVLEGNHYRLRAKVQQGILESSVIKEFMLDVESIF